MNLKPPCKKAIVSHSGGMDSSICLALAIEEFGAEQVLSLSFSYGQRHSPELAQARKIAKEWGVDHLVLPLECLQGITSNALMDQQIAITHGRSGDNVQESEIAPNTLVVGRNGLLARLCAIHADHLSAQVIYMGVIEVEAENSGYRDCTRGYMDKMEEILRIDLANPQFEIRTPIVKMTKAETMHLAHDKGVLSFLLEETITCYEGVRRQGCGTCPACELRNRGLISFLEEVPEFVAPYTPVLDLRALSRV
jgi:7-cyano-7-deazaguanine synthase